MARFTKFFSGFLRLGALAIAAATALAIPQAHAANIIGFANNATACGGSTLCSTNGTIGYNGTMPFNLSTISSWFQIGTAAQPMTAGDFLVINDTGAIVTSFSLTITDTFTLATPGQQNDCGVGVPCQNFQIHGGAANFFTTFTLTGPDCKTHCGTDSADFMPNMVTYNWSGGAGVPIGATFNLNFASWNNAVFATPPLRDVPEPTSMALLAVGLVGLGIIRRRRPVAR